MRMPLISQWVFGAMIAAGVPSMAGATITQTFTSRADFVAATSGLTNLAYDLGGSYDAPAYAVGPLIITAPGSNVFGAGSIVSTELDSNSLVLTFATPVAALGLFGGVTDEFLDYVDGTLSVTLNGGVTSVLTGTAGTGGYLGLISDVAISQVTLTIDSFDVNATSAAFVTLSEQADLASARDTSGSVPEPATWAMMLVGFGCVGGSLRRVRRSALVGQAG
jgi:hypothetical protein